MNSRGGAVFWALILIVVGAVFLLRNVGLLSVDWGVIWPVLLIVFGGAMLLGGFARRGEVATSTQSIPLDGAREARLSIQHGAGQLRVQAAADPLTLVSSTFDGELRHDVRRDGERADVRLRLEREWWFWMWPWNWGVNSRWELAVNRDVPLWLDVKTGASESRLDLRELKVRELRLDTGASSLDVELPGSGQITGRIKAGAATIRIHLPESMAVRVRANLGAATLNVRGQRFQWGNNAYQTPDYETNPNRVDLDIDGGAASITIT